MSATTHYTEKYCIQNIDAVIFDFDGVLVESTEIKTDAFVELYADQGAEVMQAVKKHHLANAGISRFAKFRYIQTEILQGKPLSKAEENSLSAAFTDLVLSKILLAPMVAGARELLDGLLPHIPMYVASGTPEDELTIIIKQRGLSHYFQQFWGTPGTKTEQIGTCLNSHKITAARCLMVGDSRSDYTGADANKVVFLGRVVSGNTNPFPADIPVVRDLSHCALVE